MSIPIELAAAVTASAAPQDAPIAKQVHLIPMHRVLRTDTKVSGCQRTNCGMLIRSTEIPHRYGPGFLTSNSLSPAERRRVKPMTQRSRKLIAVVDDDESVRESLPDLLGELGFAARAFASAEEFLASECLEDTRCLLLDIALPVMSGPELQRELLLRGQAIPVIFITARAEKNVRPRLLRQGATECLFKPFSDQDLRAAIRAAGV
jgi:CheY-like chemotaxis protein